MDVRVRNAIQRLVNPHRALLWNRQRDYLIYAGMAVVASTLAIDGLVGHHPDMTESSLLMVEAFAVSRVFSFDRSKLLTGRQGTRTMA